MKIYLYTDGACSGNPGRGGYCAILKYAGREKIVKGSSYETTNNRMELTAVIEGLKAIKVPSEVEVTTDSKYVCEAINQGWLNNWRANGFRKSNKKPVLNQDLWMELQKFLEIHSVSFKWVHGHSGHPENERCDRFAVDEYLKISV